MRQVVYWSILFIGVFLHFFELHAKEDFSHIEASIHQSLKEFHVPGVAVGIVANNEVLLAKGYGLCALDKAQGITEKTLFPIGSCSKAFTAFVLATLVDEGKVSWDDPVSQHIKDLKLWNHYLTDTLTIRDLLAHRSGLPRHDFIWLLSRKPYQETVHELEFLKPVAGLREKFLYNNLMYVLAGYLIEKITNTSWEEAVRQRILEPLGMHDTNFSITKTKESGRCAFPHEERQEKLQVIPFRDISNVGPAGSINSNCVDMLKWLQLQLAEDASLDKKKLISRANMQKMHTLWMHAGLYPEKEISPIGYGLGWEIINYKGRYNVAHNGSIDGFYAFVSFLPKEKIGVVLLTNTRPSGELLADAISRKIFDHFLHDTSTDWVAEIAKKQKIAVNRADVDQKGAPLTRPLAAYAGRYEHPAYGTMIVSVDTENKALVAKFQLIEVPLEHCCYDVWKEASTAKDPLLEDVPFVFQGSSDGTINTVLVKLEPMAEPISFIRSVKDLFFTKSYLEKFVGKYTNEKTDITITLRDNRLIAVLPAQPEYELIPEEKGIFSLKEIPGMKMRFEINEQGEVVQLFFMQPNGVFSFESTAEEYH